MLLKLVGRGQGCCSTFCKAQDSLLHQRVIQPQVGTLVHVNLVRGPLNNVPARPLQCCGQWGSPPHPRLPASERPM